MLFCLAAYEPEMTELARDPLTEVLAVFGGGGDLVDPGPRGVG